MGFLVIHYIQNLKKKIEYSLVYKYIQYQTFFKKKYPTAEKMTKKGTSTSHDLQFHQELFFSLVGKTQKPKEKDQDKLVSLCLIKRERAISMELSCELRDR